MYYLRVALYLRGRAYEKVAGMSAMNAKPSCQMEWLSERHQAEGHNRGKPPTPVIGDTPLSELLKQGNGLKRRKGPSGRGTT